MPSLPRSSENAIQEEQFFGRRVSLSLLYLLLFVCVYSDPTVVCVQLWSHVSPSIFSWLPKINPRSSCLCGKPFFTSWALSLVLVLKILSQRWKGLAPRERGVATPTPIDGWLVFSGPYASPGLPSQGGDSVPVWWMMGQWPPQWNLPGFEERQTLSTSQLVLRSTPKKQMFPPIYLISNSSF